MELLQPFNKLSKHDAAIAGGKGASLGQMTQAGIPVPPGFVILSSAFERFMEETHLIQEVDSILHKVDHKEIHTVEHASEVIQALILEAKMPKDIAVEIEKEFKSLNTEYVAVRSSATAEDSSTAAWAGQLDSFLNTTDRDLLEKVQQCWASLFTPRAIFYRFEKNLHRTKISVAVVVQKMVNSEKSGIAFSVHPVTEDYNQLIIEAGLGLGEAIVSGQITPDSYVIEKVPRRIIDKNISVQERGMYRISGGGNEWKEVERKSGEQQTLSDEEILELSELILNIEKHYGFPCDIEWAFEKGKFFIVQSRPITTLAKKSENKYKLILKNELFGTFPTVENYKAKAEIVIKYTDYILANKNWYPKGIKSKLLFMSPQGISAAAGVSSVHKIGFKLGFATYADEYMRWSYDPRDFKQIGEDLIQQNKKSSTWLSDYDNLFWNETENFADKADDMFWNFESASLVDIRARFIDIMNSAIRAQSYGYITEVFTLTDDYWVIKYINEIAPELNSDEISRLLQPSSPSFVRKFQEELALAKSRNDFKSLQRRYYWIKGSYFAQPTLTLDLLENEKKNQQIEKTSLPEKGSIINKVARKEELGKFIKMVEIFIAIQDERKANVLRLNYCLVKICALLSTEIKVWDFDDLFDLTPEEILLLIDGSLDVTYKKRIQKRNHKSVWVFTNDGYWITSEPNDLNVLFACFDDNSTSVELKGYRASGGIVKGKVKIVLSENDFSKITRGDILVTSMTRPEFMPVLEKAAAFVTDEGGITCHAAIVSREMKKPCIIGTKNATQMLRDGDMVEVDADRGVVKILK